MASSSPHRSPHADAVIEVIGQCRVQVFAGADGLIIDDVSCTVPAKLLQENVDCLQVAVAQRADAR